MLPAYIYWYIAITVVVITCVDITRRYVNFRYQLNQKLVLLELIPPAFTLKAPQATEHLFNVIHTIGLSRSLLDRLLGRTSIFSFEVVSSRSQGIRYIVCLNKADRLIFQQQLAAYLPDVRFQETEDYINVSDRIYLLEFKQARHFAYPLASHDTLTHHDPIAYLTGSMTKLAPSELIAFQVVVSPKTIREAVRVHNKLLVGEDPKLSHRRRSLPFRAVMLAVHLVFGLIRLVFGLIAELTRSYYELPRQYRSQSSASIAMPAAQELLMSLHDKLAQPLFQTSLRAMVINEDAQRAQKSLDSISAALASFSVHGYQELVSKHAFPNRLLHPYRLFNFRHRLSALFIGQDCVLAVSEIASLYHFPYGDTARPENLSTSHSRTLPAPAPLKHLSDTGGFDVVLGMNKHHDSTTPIGLTDSRA